MIILGTRLHVATYLFFVAQKVFATNETHSGFEVPWSPTRILPLANGTSHHDFHHSNNVGNYGAYTCIWDYLSGNLKHYVDYHFVKKSYDRAK